MVHQGRSRNFQAISLPYDGQWGNQLCAPTKTKYGDNLAILTSIGPSAFLNLNSV